jgi:GNAT superfamily N-acetyltransferase
MLERWYPHVSFRLAWDRFHQLPRNSAYKYEYWDGKAHLSPRPKLYHCLLDLSPCDVPETIELQCDDQVTFRPLAAADWRRFPKLFCAAFDSMPPFGLIGEEKRRQAARECLKRTRTGGDGPLVPSASSVALVDEQLCGAALVTLGHGGDLESLDDPARKVKPPADALHRRWGRPHLTWIFVAPLCARYGIGSALLGRAVNELYRLGYRELASTFLLGNESSTMWHWRNGFRLLSYIGSPGNIHRRVRESLRARESDESSGRPCTSGESSGD